MHLTLENAGISTLVANFHGLTCLWFTGKLTNDCPVDAALTHASITRGISNLRMIYIYNLYLYYLTRTGMANDFWGFKRQGVETTSISGTPGGIIKFNNNIRHRNNSINIHCILVTTDNL